VEDEERLVIRFLTSDMAKYLPGVLAPALVGLVEIPILTGLFSPQEYGSYALTITMVVVLDLCAGWLTLSVLRFYPAAERDQRLGSLYGSVLLSAAGWIALLAGGLITVVLALSSTLAARQREFLLIGSAIFVVLAYFHVLLHFLRASRRVGWYSAFSVWLHLARLAIALTLVRVMGWGLEGFLWAYVISLAVACPFLQWISLPPGQHLRLRAEGRIIAQMLRYGFPLVVCLLMDWAMNLSNLFFLKYFRSPDEVGIYAASQGVFSKGLFLLTTLFHTAAMPLEMRVWEKEGPDQARRFLSQVSRYFILVCLPLAGLLVVLARPIVVVLTAREYHQGYRIVPFLVAGGLLLGLQQRFQGGLLFRSRSILVMCGFLLAALGNLGLNLLLIPRYGYMGAAAGVTGGYVLLLSFMCITSRRFFSWPFPVRSLARSALAVAVAAGTVWGLGQMVGQAHWVLILVGVPSGLVVYVAAVVLLGEVSPREWQALRELVLRSDRRAPEPVVVEEQTGP